MLFEVIKLGRRYFQKKKRENSPAKQRENTKLTEEGPSFSPIQCTQRVALYLLCSGSPERSYLTRLASGSTVMYMGQPRNRLLPSSSPLSMCSSHLSPATAAGRNRLLPPPALGVNAAPTPRPALLEPSPPLVRHPPAGHPSKPRTPRTLTPITGTHTLSDELPTRTAPTPFFVKILPRLRRRRRARPASSSPSPARSWPHLRRGDTASRVD